MSEVKWIKLTTTMFDDEKIKLIESMPDADSLLIVWIKLLCQAGKTNASGHIYLDEETPYTDEMLSIIFNRPVDVIRRALDILAEYGLIERTDFLSINRWEKYIKPRFRKALGSLRDYILKRDGYRCVYCGANKTVFELDHVIPFSRGGSDDAENLVCSCVKCNRSKKDKLPHEWRATHGCL